MDPVKELSLLLSRLFLCLKISLNLLVGDWSFKYLDVSLILLSIFLFLFDLKMLSITLTLLNLNVLFGRFSISTVCTMEDNGLYTSGCPS
jgi:hypothetical protein